MNRKILTIVLAVIVIAAGLVTYTITSIQPSTQPAPTEQTATHYSTNHDYRTGVHYNSMENNGC